MRDWCERIGVGVPSKEMLADLRAPNLQEFALSKTEQCIQKEHPNYWEKFWDVHSPANEGRCGIGKRRREWLLVGNILG